MSAAEPPLSAAFARAMAAFAPFEPAPRLAVAVSGGADSMALCLLADGWARAEGGSITALIVDHQLRAGSGSEAAQVGAWLHRREISHHRLVWEGPKPLSGIQATARTARYGLLTGWCRQAGIRHLLVGHQAMDQAETVLMRVWRASGLSGLAGMSPLVELGPPERRPGEGGPEERGPEERGPEELGEVRVLRPLLDSSPERLRRYLTARNQPWIDDPSNRKPAFARVRLRKAATSLAAAGIDRTALLDLAAAARAAREATEDAVTALLRETVTLHPAGFARVEGTRWRSAARFIAVRALARLLRVIGGRQREPADRGVERLLSALLAPDCPRAAATLCGCRLQRSGDRVLVWRETRGLPAPQAVTGGGRIVWDGRYLLDIEIEGRPRTLRLQALRAAPLREIAAASPGGEDVPKVVWPTLPCLTDAGGVLHVPHLGYWRGDDRLSGIGVRTRLRQSLTGRASFLV